jgi:hypothetical protein
VQCLYRRGPHPCGDRREYVYPACSEVYKGDAWQIIRSGLVADGEGLPETVAVHPCMFVTITAPGFAPSAQDPHPAGLAQAAVKCSGVALGRAEPGHVGLLNLARMSCGLLTIL